MCSTASFEFTQRLFSPPDITGRHVLEVGSFDVNGSLRKYFELHSPATYLGVDITHGPGVDCICSIHNLTTRLGRERFDIVICTEVLEHVRDWRSAIYNLKSTLKTGGLLLLTTRSRGFHYHPYPCDYWRFEGEDILRIFSDFEVQALESDPEAPGVFVKAGKLRPNQPEELSRYRLFSMIAGTRTAKISRLEEAVFTSRRQIKGFLSRIIPARVKRIARRWGILQSTKLA